MENLIIFLQSYILEMLIIFTGIVAIYGWSTRNKLISLMEYVRYNMDAIKELDSVRDENCRIIKEALESLNSSRSDMLDMIVHNHKALDGHVSNDFQCVKNKVKKLEKDLEDHIACSKMMVATDREERKD